MNDEILILFILIHKTAYRKNQVKLTTEKSGNVNL